MIKKIVFILFLFSLLVIVGCSNNNPANEEIIKCIGQKVTLYVSEGCTHCVKQKQILGEIIKYIDLIDCSENSQACQNAGIRYVPTWIINGEKITGAQTIEVLKTLTGC